MPRKSMASGQAAAKAMRIRVAVSVTRAAILSRRIRSVANSAVASVCGLGIAARSVSMSHMWTAPSSQGVGHMWTAPSSQGVGQCFDQIACVHMSGL